jgi:hypothetical protein
MNKNVSGKKKTGAAGGRGQWRREMDEMKMDMGLMTERQLRFATVRDFCTRLAIVLSGRKKQADKGNVISFDELNRHTG